jgi:PAS domain S-box-containing protein
MTRKTAAKNARQNRRAPTLTRKRDSRSLRSETHLARAQRLARTGSWVFRISSGRSVWSLELFQILAFDPKSKTPSLSAFLERVHPEDRLDVEARIDRAVHEHRGCEHDYRLMFSDGSIKHIHAVLEPVADRSGKVYEIVGTATDITEQIRAETELRRSEAYLAEAERISHTGCWARNPTSGALFWSQEEWRIFGLDPRKTKLSYELFLQMIHPDDRSHVKETSKRAVEEAKEYDIPFRIVLPDGSIKHIHSVGKPFFEENGKLTEYIGVSMDVTERKRDEEALQLAHAKNERLRQLEVDLAHMNRVSMMGELAASLAHEITQPIASARNNARAALNFLDQRPSDLGEVREALDCVVGDSDRAGDIIDRIRAHIKKAPPRKGRFDLNAAINEVIVLARSAIIKNGVSVETRLADGLLPVQGDRVQVQQVLLNLVLNAVEAVGLVEAGARELSIRTEQDQTRVLVAVRDSGPGIDPEHLERVFEAFYSTKSSGTGMGLSICRSIIDAHGGRLWAEANEPRGAVFQFTLPSA